MTLVADSGPRWRDVLDLAAGVCRAWMVPVFGGGQVQQRRARLQATTITVLAAWSAALLGAAGFSKTVDDPPLPGLHGASAAALHAGAVLLEVTGAVVLVTGFVFWLAVIVPALRARRRDVVVPAVAPALFAGAWLGVTGLVALFAHHYVRRADVALTWPRGAAVLAVLVAWLAVTLVCAAGCAASAAVALRRAQMSVTGLATSTVIAAVAAVGVGGQALAAVVCLVGLLRAGGGLRGRDTVFGTGSCAVLVIVTVVAGVSVARGLKVLRPGPPGPLNQAA